MNCKCIENIQAKLRRDFRQHGYTKIKIDFPFFKSPVIGKLTYSVFTVNGFMRRPAQELIPHSFCPFCGTEVERKFFKNEEEVKSALEEFTKMLTGPLKK